MAIVQVTCLFNYHLLSYLSNLFEQVYMTIIIMVSAEFFSYIIGGVLLEKLGTKLSLIILYLLSGIGGLLMLVYGLNHVESVAFPILFLICRFGVSAINVLFTAANARIFDIEKSATAFGLGSFFARMILSTAPVVSTLPQPLPMVIFTLTTVATAFVIMLLKVHPDTERKIKTQKQTSTTETQENNKTKKTEAI